LCRVVQTYLLRSTSPIMNKCDSTKIELQDGDNTKRILLIQFVMGFQGKEMVWLDSLMVVFHNKRTELVIVK
jgi:hypothetical protein